MKDMLYIGLDTDKEWIDISAAEPPPGGEVRYFGKIANQAASLDRALKRLRKEGRTLVACYEAGPCGYGIHRRLNGRPGVTCQVIAPSLTPRRPGDRVKINRRDSLTLARLLRAAEPTPIWVPDAAHEATRGYGLINAVTVVAEIGDPRRFDSPRQLMAFVGLVPSERSSGESRRRGGLTKTGNVPARKALIEAAWTCARPVKRPKAAAVRQSAEVRAIARAAGPDRC